MGVSIDVWRARVGAFAPIMNKILSHQKRVWPQRKRHGANKRQMKDPSTLHVSIEVFVCLLCLLITCLSRRHGPVKDIPDHVFDTLQLTLNGAMKVYLAICLHGERRRTLQGKLTMALRLVLFVILLLCGDVESNPGPGPGPVDGARPKRILKIQLLDTKEKIGTATWTLDDAWCDVSKKWPNVTQDEYILTEDDGTEIISDDHYQALDHKTILQLCLKSPSEAASSQPPRVRRPLTDDVINHIAVNRLTHRISRLGLAMGFPLAMITKYEAENDREPRAESRGTKNMIQHWREECTASDQVEAFCAVLQEAQLSELAGDLSSGHEDATLTPITEKQLEQCIEDIHQSYLQSICMIQADPLNPKHQLALEKIFTTLKVLEQDKTAEKKIEIDYKHLLKTDINGFRPKRFLIEGEGGAGKSTLCAKIAWDWIKRLNFTEIKLVLLVRLRDSFNLTVGQAVKSYLSDNNSVEAKQLDQYILSNPDKVLIILDGFDEIDGDLTTQREIIQILLMKRFKSTRVIVTSRSWKADLIRQTPELAKAYAFIYVEGFNKENLSIYIKRFYAKDLTSGQDLIQFMAENDIISENMAPFPIYTAMLCILWKDPNRRETMHKLQTFSQLFYEIILFLVDHYLCKLNKSQEELVSERDGAISTLAQIGKIAFDGLKINRLNFQEKLFSSSEDVEMGCKLGVLTSEKKIISRNERKENGHTPELSVSFPHKLFQEFASALYLESIFKSDRAAYDKVMTEVIIPSMQEYRYLLYFTSSRGLDIGLNIMNKVICQSSAHTRNMDGDFSVDVAFECHDQAASASMVAERLLSHTKELAINQSAHTVSAYLYIMRHCQLPLEKLVVGKRCGRTNSCDLAEFICSSPTLRDVFFYFASLHEDFFSLVDTKKGKSKVEKLAIQLIALSAAQLQVMVSLPHLHSLTIGRINSPAGPAAQKSDNLVIIPGSVKTFFIDNDTPEHFHFDCRERMEKVTLDIDGSVTSDIVKKLPEMEELHLYKECRTFPSQWASIDDYPSMCSLIHTHLPHMTRLTFASLRIGNRNAKSILQSLRIHPNLQYVSMFECDTRPDEELDSLIRDLTDQGMQVDIIHGKADDEKEGQDEHCVLIEVENVTLGEDQNNYTINDDGNDMLDEDEIMIIEDENPTMKKKRKLTTE